MSDAAQTDARPNAIRALYAWVMNHAHGRHAWWALAAFAFAEASFFPIPPDVMLVPMVLADRRRAFWLAGWCTLWSVLGGALGYTIGAALYNSVGHWLIQAYGMGGELGAFRAAYAKYGYWIMLQGLTPIPYKLVTIASGFAGFNLALFMLLSTITRGVRFTLVCGLLWWMGEPVKLFLEKRLELMLLLFLAAVAAGFVIVHYIF